MPYVGNCVKSTLTDHKRAAPQGRYQTPCEDAFSLIEMEVEYGQGTVGKVAKGAGVKKLVLMRFVPVDDVSITDKMWAGPVRAQFDGEIAVGKDLLEV